MLSAIQIKELERQNLTNMTEDAKLALVIRLTMEEEKKDAQIKKLKDQIKHFESTKEPMLETKQFSDWTREEDRVLLELIISGSNPNDVIGFSSRLPNRNAVEVKKRYDFLIHYLENDYEPN